MGKGTDKGRGISKGKRDESGEKSYRNPTLRERRRGRFYKGPIREEENEGSKKSFTYSGGKKIQNGGRVYISFAKNKSTNTKNL